MDVKEFSFELPEELIAQQPIENRSDSRLMILHRGDGRIQHRTFKDIVNFMSPGDCLVLNDTKVMPARIYGRRADTGGSIEFVLLKKIHGDDWEVLVRPGKRAKTGAIFSFGEGKLLAKVLGYTEAGGRVVSFSHRGKLEEVLEKIGQMPIPPYIKRRLEDPRRYQTVYAKNYGSAAAPTAGLHFTEALLSELKSRGVNLAYITLHVGLGTFRPVKVKKVEEHYMHSEYYEISESTADIINTTVENGNKVYSVGTTSTRTLETVAGANGMVSPGKGWSDIFIYPGYKFKSVQGIITNFHLPESTLIMLVSAFAGKDNILNAYRKAVNDNYRFFSFGDAMLIM